MQGQIAKKKKASDTVPTKLTKMYKSPSGRQEV